MARLNMHGFPVRRKMQPKEFREWIWGDLEDFKFSLDKFGEATAAMVVNDFVDDICIGVEEKPGRLKLMAFCGLGWDSWVSEGDGIHIDFDLRRHIIEQGIYVFGDEEIRKGWVKELRSLANYIEKAPKAIERLEKRLELALEQRLAQGIANKKEGQERRKAAREKRERGL